MTAPTFPFSAVVGHDEVKLALELVAADPAIGGVLLRGQKGSAKTTLARALVALLPGSAPFVELPVGATEDRVIGSIDLAAALTGGEVRFRAGLLAAAHGGVLYVDEVNLLPDHLVDVLLDVSQSGVNRVEREGVSHSHPSRFVLIGSMNPEEGELRPQLLDRFGLAVDVTTSTDPDERAEAVTRRLAFDADPHGFAAGWNPADAAVAERLATLTPAAVDRSLRRTVSALSASMGAEGLRADLVICRSAAALAGLDGREEATVGDVRRVAPLALAHRRRRQPFDDPGIDQREVDQALADAAGPAHPQPSDEAAASGGEGADNTSETDGRADGHADGHADGQSDGQGDGRSDGRSDGQGPESKVAPAPAGRMVRLEAPPTVVAGTGNGRRSPAEASSGRLVGARQPAGPISSVAVAATVRAAAARRAAEPTAVIDGMPLVGAADLREAVRERRTGNLLILAVDASGSMGAARRMEAAKGAVMTLLLDAYQKRDRVALVTFRDQGANVALRPTTSVEVAKARLTDLPTGGRTPLAAGITAALDLARKPHGGEHQPMVVLLTDGRATAAPDGMDAYQAALEAATAVRRASVPAVVIDAEDPAATVRLGLAADLAGAMGARYLTLPELSGSAVAGALRNL